MKKLFISQPMGGKSEEEILKLREDAIKAVKDYCNDSDIEVIDSYIETAPADASPFWYLGESIKMLADADIVFLVDGWQNARGCKVEYICALEYGIPCISIVSDNIKMYDTIQMMLSSDYRERFAAEYYQTAIRLAKLQNMLDNWDNLDFKPTCSRELYDRLVKAMTEYIDVLKERANIESICLDIIML